VPDAPSLIGKFAVDAGSLFGDNFRPITEAGP
jgi:hypothetical protein